MAKRKMSENSLKNLEKGKPFSKDCEEIARNAQAKSVTKRKENQTLSELMKIALTFPNEATGETNNIAITNALINKAIKGDVAAYTTIRDTIGEKPTDKQEIKTNHPTLALDVDESYLKKVIEQINSLADE